MLADTPTEVLLKIMGNLLDGLTVVGEHIEAGTFHTPDPNKSGGVPPSQSGQTTLLLIIEIAHELAKRGHPEMANVLSEVI